MELNDRRFAVLIDADNVSPKYIKYILNEVSDLGVATYKRIYGDWTDTEKKSWKNVLLDWSVNPIQQYSYTTGKNSTDSAMIIDAMDTMVFTLEISSPVSIMVVETSTSTSPLIKSYITCSSSLWLI